MQPTTQSVYSQPLPPHSVSCHLIVSIATTYSVGWHLTQCQLAPTNVLGVGGGGCDGVLIALREPVLEVSGARQAGGAQARICGQHQGLTYTTIPLADVTTSPHTYWLSSRGARMASVWKRLQRVNKRAAKFQYTASYHRVDLDTTPKCAATAGHSALTAQRVNKRAAKFQYTASYHRVDLDTTPKCAATAGHSALTAQRVNKRAAKFQYTASTSTPRPNGNYNQTLGVSAATAGHSALTAQRVNKRAAKFQYTASYHRVDLDTTPKCAATAGHSALTAQRVNKRAAKFQYTASYHRVDLDTTPKCAATAGHSALTAQRVNKRAAKFQYTASYHRVDLDTTPKCAATAGHSALTAQRVNKRAAKFQYTASYHRVDLDTTPKCAATAGHSALTAQRVNKRAAKFQYTASYHRVDLDTTPKCAATAGHSALTAQRVNKRAAEFQYTASHHRVDLDTTPKWKPNKLSIVWTRRSRRPSQRALMLTLEPTSSKIAAAADEDMQSLASLLSVNNNSDIAVLEDLDEDDYTLSDNSTRQMEEMTQSLTNSDIAATPNSVQSLNFDNSRTPTAPLTPITPITPSTPVSDQTPTNDLKIIDTIPKKHEFLNKLTLKCEPKTSTPKVTTPQENFKNVMFKPKMISRTNLKPLELKSNFNSTRPIGVVPSRHRGVQGVSGHQPDDQLPVLTAADVCKRQPDRLAIMTYLFQLRAHFTGNELQVEQLGNDETESSYLVGRHDTDGSLPRELFSREVATRRSRNLEGRPRPGSQESQVSVPSRQSQERYTPEKFWKGPDTVFVDNGLQFTGSEFRVMIHTTICARNEPQPPEPKPKIEPAISDPLSVQDTEKQETEKLHIKETTPELPKPTPQLLSRHDELKERARQLLEATKREARAKEKKRQESKEKDEKEQNGIRNGDLSPQKPMTEEERQQMLRERAKKLIANARAGIIRALTPVLAPDTRPAPTDQERETGSYIQSELEALEKEQSAIDERAAALEKQLRGVMQSADNTERNSCAASCRVLTTRRYGYGHGRALDKEQSAIDERAAALEKQLRGVMQSADNTERNSCAASCRVLTTRRYGYGHGRALDKEQSAIDERAAALEKQLRGVMQSADNTERNSCAASCRVLTTRRYGYGHGRALDKEQSAIDERAAALEKQLRGVMQSADNTEVRVRSRASVGQRAERHRRARAALEKQLRGVMQSADNTERNSCAASCRVLTTRRYGYGHGRALDKEQSAIDERAAALEKQLRGVMQSADNTERNSCAASCRVLTTRRYGYGHGRALDKEQSAIDERAAALEKQLRGVMQSADNTERNSCAASCRVLTTRRYGYGHGRALDKEQSAIDERAAALEKQLRGVMQSADNTERNSCAASCRVLTTRRYGYGHGRALDKEQSAIDERAAALEKQLRGVMQSADNTEEEDRLMSQWFNLELLAAVNERDRLVQEMDEQEKAFKKLYLIK
ncbi:hypothetical protein MSG28_015819, partial [Choristoneura fumiferana]